MTTTKIEEEVEIRAFSHQSTNDKVFELVKPYLKRGIRVLDLGAGEGYFSKLVSEYMAAEWNIVPAAVLFACDVKPSLFRYRGITCDSMASDGTLPYEDSSFDVVCCLEVIEHVEDQVGFCREIVRVLRPGGTCVLSTPNILNLNSRYRNLHSGFATLFDPLSLSTTDALHTSGHINPIGYYYLAYDFFRAGARDISVHFDRYKRSAMLLLLIFWPFVLLGNFLFRIKLSRRKKKIFDENAALIRAIGSLGMLTSRSIIVRVHK